MTGCGRGGAVQQAASSGRWTKALSDHVSTCAACGEVAVVSATLNSPPVPPPPSVSPAILWARARHKRRLRAEATASRILTAGQVAAGVAALGIAAVLAGQIQAWPTLVQMVEYAALTLGITGLAAAGVLAMTRWLSEI